MDDRQNGEPTGNRPGWPNPQPPGAAWPPPPTSPGAAAYFGPFYTSPASSARWAIGFLVAVTVLDIITASVEFVQARNAFSIELGLIAGGLSLLQFFLSLPCAVFFLIWVYRICSNALALGALDMPISPGWAVGYFFIPILNLFRPYQAIRDVWKASGPGLDLRGNPESWRRAPYSPLVGWWWAYWLFYNLAAVCDVVLSFTLREAMQRIGVPALIDSLHTGLTLVAIRLVLLLTRRQDEAYRKLVGGGFPQ